MRSSRLETSFGTSRSTPRHAELSSIDVRRQRGVYYTPRALAETLSAWALAPGPSAILDPSFGSGVFLEAGVNVLAGQGLKEPGRLIYGVDVDATCIDHVRTSTHLLAGNCLIQDFLTLSPLDLPGAPFGAVVGNPPFVRHHWFKGTSRAAGRQAMEAAGVDLPQRASAWAYFVIHSLGFLASGGRLAMLVPEAIHQADYGVAVSQTLAARFDEVHLVHIRDRLFDRTKETVIALMANGYGGAGSITAETVESMADLKSLLLGKADHRLVGSVFLNGRPVSREAISVVRELEQHKSVRRLEDVANVRVGLVTGANSHFLRRWDEVEQLAMSTEAPQAVVSRTRWLAGLDFIDGDLTRLVEAGRRTALVRPDADGPYSEGVAQWIGEGEARQLNLRFKCAGREPWFCVPLISRPDAFASCTRLGSPLLVLNRTGCLCTNALHAVYWREPACSPEVVAIGILTSLVGVWSEINGRRYGGGVLKMEPGTWKRIPVPLIEESKRAFAEVNEMIRLGFEAKARLLADELVLREGLGLSRADVQSLQGALSFLKAHRRPGKIEDDYG